MTMMIRVVAAVVMVMAMIMIMIIIITFINVLAQHMQRQMRSKTEKMAVIKWNNFILPYAEDKL